MGRGAPVALAAGGIGVAFAGLALVLNGACGGELNGAPVVADGGDAGDLPLVDEGCTLLAPRRCGETCVDPSRDVKHCGGCSRTCEPLPNEEATCVPDGGGTCLRCEVGARLCDGLCVDVQTSGAHCGACGRSCLGGPCREGRCQPAVLVSTKARIDALAVDPTGPDIFYLETEQETCTLVRRPKDAPCGEGGAPNGPCRLDASRVDDAGFPYNPMFLAADETSVAVGTRDGDLRVTDKALRGWTAQGSTGSDLNRLAVAGGRAIWGTGGGDLVGILGGSILMSTGTSRFVAGLTAVQLPSGTVTFAAVASPSSIVNYIYRLEGARCVDGACRLLRAQPRQAQRLAVADGWLYWTQADDVAPTTFTVWKERLEGGCGVGAVCPILVTTGRRLFNAEPRDVVVDGRFIYWLDVWEAQASLRRGAVIEPCDAAPCGEVLITASQRAGSLAADQGSLYFQEVVDEGGQAWDRILRLAK